MQRLKLSVIAVGITIALFSGTTYANGEKPTAFFSASPMSGNTPLDVTLDASASHDPDGSITSYTWADSRGNTASGTTTTLNFAEDGLYSVILTVTDNDGNTDTALRTISVGLDACQGHATYSGENGVLYIPFVDMPTIPMIGGNHNPSNNQRAVIEATLQLIDASNLFEIEAIKLRSPTVITGESNECHAVYSLDGNLRIPYVDLPLLTILNGIPIPFGVETYQATMQLIPFSDLFLIESVTPVGEVPDKDACTIAAVSEANLLFSGIKTEMNTWYADIGNWPATLQELEWLVTEGTYVKETVYAYNNEQPQIVMTLDGFESGANQIGWKWIKSGEWTGKWTCKASENDGLTTISTQCLFKACGGLIINKHSAVSEANLLFSGIKTEIGTWYADTGNWPATLQDLLVVTEGTYVTNMVYTYDAEQPQIVMTVDDFEPGANQIGWKYVLDENNQNKWTCKPSENGGLTTIPSEYLPNACK